MGRIYDATCGWGFSAIWDRGMRRSEESGLRDMRARVLGEASGRTLDIGAGTGANIGLFPAAVTELFFVEPDVHMVKKLRPKLAAAGSPGEVVQAGAEELPFEDSSIDTAAFTLALCTIPNPDAALAEAIRVLRPGGRVLFLEHVLSGEPGLSRWQNRLFKQWRFAFDGCHCNRDTVATIEASPLTLEWVDTGEMLKVPPLVRPLALGSAVLPAS
jgi:ubiquinone/menaquinone biosynthesis C-methylase UbiE